MPNLASASALTVDLWFSRASVAAFKAKENKMLADQDRDAVQQLREYLQRQLEASQQTGHLSPDAVPEDSLRTRLDTALANFVQTKSDAILSPLVLASLIGRLSNLEGANISESEASNLIAELHEINKWNFSTKDFPVINDLDG